jgi:hypothetical protein
MRKLSYLKKKESLYKWLLKNLKMIYRYAFVLHVKMGKGI